MVRRVLLIALVGAGLILTACGGDDGSPESSNSAAGTTGSGGPTSQIPPIPEIPGGTSGKGGGNGSSGANNGSSGSDGSSGNGGSRGTKGRQRGSSAPGTSPGPGGGASPTEPPAATSDSAVQKLAKEICANVTLEGIAINLRINLGKRDPEFVAKAFSRRYPTHNRDAAYKGCLEGFRNPVKRP